VQKGFKFWRLGKKQIKREQRAGKHTSLLETRTETVPTVLLVGLEHGHCQEFSWDCISLQPRAYYQIQMIPVSRNFRRFTMLVEGCMSTIFRKKATWKFFLGISVGSLPTDF